MFDLISCFLLKQRYSLLAFLSVCGFFYRCWICVFLPSKRWLTYFSTFFFVVQIRTLYCTSHLHTWTVKFLAEITIAYAMMLCEHFVIQSDQFQKQACAISASSTRHCPNTQYMQTCIRLVCRFCGEKRLINWDGLAIHSKWQQRVTIYHQLNVFARCKQNTKTNHYPKRQHTTCPLSFSICKEMHHCTSRLLWHCNISVY